MGLLDKKEHRNKLRSSAEVIDKHLILSLPNAIDPIIWRMSLDKIGTASFEIKQTKANDNYKLVLKPKKGTAETIATFNVKDKALEALLNASDALQTPEPAGVVQYSKTNKEYNANNTTNTEKKGTHKWLYLFIGFLAVIALYSYMSSLAPKENKNFGTTNQAKITSNSTPQEQTGVAVSADDFLNGL